MGKQKRQKKKCHKKNPTGLPSVKDFEEAEEVNCTNKDQENALDRVYEEIQSVSIEEKLSGLQTLESMSCDSKLAVRIANDGIAKMIGPLLVDYNMPVRAAAACALRHIADSGKTEAYACLLKDDIMTPLSALLKQHYMEWQPKEQKEQGKIDDEKETLVETVTLLWTLCENNESAIKYCNNEDLISVLMKFLDVTIYGMEITMVAAQCLLSLSEDNPVAIEKLKSCQETLLDLLNLEAKNSAEVIGLKTVITGLLMNLTDSMENPINIIGKVITILSETLLIDCKQLLNDLVSIIPHTKNTFSSKAKKKVRDSRKIFSAQQQALEILANLCTEDQENDDDSDLDDSEDSDSEMEGIESASMDDKSYKMLFSLPLEIVEVLNSCKILKKICEKTVAVDKDTREILEQNIEGKSVLEQMHTLRCRAYFCLNNLISSLEIEDLGGMDNIFRMWSEIGIIIFKDVDPNDIDLLESATAAMRAALQRLSEAKTSIFHNLTLADVQPMLNGERQCPNANVRANLLRVLGNLTLILTNNDNPEAQELIKHLSIFLLNTCKVESEAWVIAESLDTIMDIYAEDDSDQLASDIQLVEQLKSLVPIFKSKIRQQRKSLGENAPVVSTVNTNITRFIKYKEKRIKKG